MGRVSDLPSPAADQPTRSGSSFVLWTGVFLVLFLVFILVVSPRLQDQLGMTEGTRDLPTPSGDPVVVALTLDGREVGTATWDAEGVCAEITDDAGQTFRTCARPESLRPIWAIDAPDDADPGYVIVASPQEVASVGGLTAAGDPINGLTQARELPAGWTLIPLEEGESVARLVAFDVEGDELGDALCGTEDAPTDGPDRLSGGCEVPRQD